MANTLHHMSRASSNVYESDQSSVLSAVLQLLHKVLSLVDSTWCNDGMSVPIAPTECLDICISITVDELICLYHIVLWTPRFGAG